MHPITQAAFSTFAEQLSGDAHPEALSGAERLAQPPSPRPQGTDRANFRHFSWITGNPEIIFLV
jgi:hypothetical protein